tara:strand:+ start:98 stop:205 length:108 start_codon:yes stop_codon:yes gene_type:complete
MMYNLEVMGLIIVYIKNPHISARVTTIGSYLRLRF